MADTEVYSACPGCLRLQPKGYGAQHSLPQAFQRHNPGNYFKERNTNVSLGILVCSIAGNFHDESIWRVKIRIRYLHMTHNPLRCWGVTSRRNVWYRDKN